MWNICLFGVICLYYPGIATTVFTNLRWLNIGIDYETN